MSKRITSLREVAPRRVGNLRETALPGSANASSVPGVDTPAEKTERDFWQSVLELINSNGADTAATVKALKSEAEARMAKLSESAVGRAVKADNFRPRLHLRPHVAAGASVGLLEATSKRTAEKFPATHEDFMRALKKR